jgi:glutamine synthetase
MLLAGLDGIHRKIDPTKAGFGPIDQNVFTWTDDQRSQIKGLPASLNEALHALEADHEFLTTSGIFTEELLRQWVDFKRNQEYYAVRNRPHPYEMNLYFDV